MMSEIITHADIKIFQDIRMPNGDVIVLANPAYGWIDKSIDSANHNVFRIDSSGDIIWQVRREEDGFVNWESRNLHAKENDPTCEGYLDPFLAMSEKFFVREEVLSKGPFHPKFKEVYFDEYKPGRLLWLITGRWAYDLDPETGIATCTGEQVKQNIQSLKKATLTTNVRNARGRVSAL